MPVLSDDAVRRLRMRSQGLTGERARTVAAATRAVGALQAQDVRASRLAVRCRSHGLDAAGVARACGSERSVVRTWLMRGTLHMVPAEDVGWMLGLFGDRFAAADRRRRLELGLDDETCSRALPAIRASLAGGGQLSRADLVVEVRARGVEVDPDGQAPAHLAAYAALRGLICRGPEAAGEEPTYVLLDEWLERPRAVDPRTALGELARRYVRGHGPATPEDLARWSGLGLGQARSGFALVARELVEVETGAGPAWMAAGAGLPDRAPCVRLLPAFDAYLLGYRSRDLLLPARIARRVQAGGGIIHPTVVVDGLVSGTWGLSRRAGRVTGVDVGPDEALPEGARPCLDAEVSDVLRFLGAGDSGILA
jgi:hypothetical protein